MIKNQRVVDNKSYRVDKKKYNLAKNYVRNVQKGVSKHHNEGKRKG